MKKQILIIIPFFIFVTLLVTLILFNNSIIKISGQINIGKIEKITIINSDEKRDLSKGDNDFNNILEVIKNKKIKYTSVPYDSWDDYCIILSNNKDELILFPCAEIIVIRNNKVIKMDSSEYQQLESIIGLPEQSP